MFAEGDIRSQADAPGPHDDDHATPVPRAPLDRLADAASEQSTAVANLNSVLAQDRAQQARRVFGSDLDYLTAQDRRLIRAVTGEAITQGQVPHERPLSAFAMQIAVDRRTGELAEGEQTSRVYLDRTRARLDDLGVPTNPFTGPTLARAKGFLADRAAEAATS